MPKRKHVLNSESSVVPDPDYNTPGVPASLPIIYTDYSNLLRPVKRIINVSLSSKDASVLSVIQIAAQTLKSQFTDSGVGSQISEYNLVWNDADEEAGFWDDGEGEDEEEEEGRG
ncbi:hypothetical protein VKT23_010082 [Stygiomarasmius scandens]|uniref:Uncharacterized protein n=1 Tax=Marasmiellus scandens TaxID=2682957 RepID=A0ABR1JGC2_9AGAR